MTKLIAIAFAALGILSLAAPPAAAQWRGQPLGNSYYWNGPNGQHFSCSKLGNTTYCN